MNDQGLSQNESVGWWGASIQKELRIKPRFSEPHVTQTSEGSGVLAGVELYNDGAFCISAGR
ncbi:hypothetical protein CLU90_4850 [Janthinobacterium sp. 67]|nr:hypothetical protein CLU90_4850 [Janthinobacterium sp. 67]